VTTGSSSDRGSATLWTLVLTMTLRRQVNFALLQFLSGVPSIEVSAEARSDASLRQ